MSNLDSNFSYRLNAKLMIAELNSLLDYEDYQQYRVVRKLKEPGRNPIEQTLVVRDLFSGQFRLVQKINKSMTNVNPDEQAKCIEKLKSIQKIVDLENNSLIRVREMFHMKLDNHESVEYLFLVTDFYEVKQTNINRIIFFWLLS